MSDADGIIIVLDSTSDIETTTYQLKYWLSFVRDNTDGASSDILLECFVFMNKKDLLNPQIHYDFGPVYAVCQVENPYQDHHIHFHWTSINMGETGLEVRQGKQDTMQAVIDEIDTGVFLQNVPHFDVSKASEEIDLSKAIIKNNKSRKCC